MSILDRNIVLKLNAGWKGIHVSSVQSGLGDMFSADSPHMALDMTLDSKGRLDWANPLYWDEWIKLPIRDGDFTIQAAHSLVRCPIIIIAKNYSGMPIKDPKYSKDSIKLRDGNRCQYTGELLTKHESTVDHIIPKFRGGRDSWDNCVTSKKSVNHKKGHQLNSECGLSLLKIPTTPKPMPASEVIRLKGIKHPFWAPFL
tara:strand:- start:5589 stop:6188 length:600 start_codon:yes stop_codon:yes gene_type:complete